MDASLNQPTSLSSILASALAQSDAQTEECKQLQASLEDCRQQVKKLQEQANLVDELKREHEKVRWRLRESLVKYKVEAQRASQAWASYEHLLEENHLKEAKIESLEDQLKTVQAKARKWRSVYAASSSSARSDSPGVPEPAGVKLNMVQHPPASTIVVSKSPTVQEPRNPLLPTVTREIELQNFDLDVASTSPTAGQIPSRSSSPHLPTPPVIGAPRINSDHGPSGINVTRRPLEKPAGDNSELDIQMLNEVSGNGQQRAKVGPDTKLSTPAMKRKPNENRGAMAIPTVAEDGEEYNRATHSSAKDQALRTSTPANTSAHQRLGDLLSEPRPSKPMLGQLTRTPQTTTISALSKSSPLEPIATSKFLPFKRPHLLSSPGGNGNAQQPVEPAAKRRSPFLPPVQRPSLRDPPAGPEDQEPLRARPLHRLALCHFRIDPASNAGLDYAYSSVLRNQSARKCQPGCADARCCGNTFRALARTLPSMAKATDQERRDPSEHEIMNCISEHDLLLSMLGSGSGAKSEAETETKIRALTAVARRNLIHEARIAMLASLYGKQHRDEHARRAESPPGFWRTEFPASQEGRDDRAEAERREREEVRKRYEDAIKGGGKWCFADE